MQDHFSAFSFVDRITSVEPGVRIRGRYTIPPGIDAFPDSLIAEAVGQLAAWAAMKAVNFEYRPVAGLVGKVELLSRVRPGQVLELTAEIDSVDIEAVAYHGVAQVDGVPVLYLEHTVGPMVPMADFHDPQAMRDRFELLCGPGAAPCRFNGVLPFQIDHTKSDASQSVRMTLHVPTAAPFFADHFPRRPVFPGSLLMNVNLQLVASLAATIPTPVKSAAWVVQSISDIKLRAFIPPGEVLELEAKLSERSGNDLSIAVEVRREKKTIGGARVLLTAKS